ncbi:MAG: DUF1515 family protein [Rhizobiales bacterium]|nr:DUF1515 family protein [Hyphomicrobiales bacterium]
MADAASYERIIGKLEAQIAALAEQLRSVSVQVEANRRESSEGRSRMYREMESIRGEATETRHKIEKVASDLAESQPVVVEIKRWKERFIGMQMLLGAGAAMIGGGIVLGWKWIGAKLGIG